MTMALGIGVALLVFPDLPPAAAAVIATAVAPTDAALGEAVTGNPEVPRRIRVALGVESGLNDGIATPFVLFFIATAASEAGGGGVPQAAVALGDVITGVLVGLGAGLGGGLLLVIAVRHRWAAQKYRATGVLALALFTYCAAVQLGGNGFIAAFVGGLAFGAVVVRPVRRSSLGFDARAGEMLSLLVWFVFGALALKVLGAALSWRTVVFAVLALTVIRFVPVALSLLGSHLGWWSVAFIGWFGPRGLAWSSSGSSRPTRCPEQRATSSSPRSR